MQLIDSYVEENSEKADRLESEAKKNGGKVGLINETLKELYL